MSGHCYTNFKMASEEQHLVFSLATVTINIMILYEEQYFFFGLATVTTNFKMESV